MVTVVKDGVAFIVAEEASGAYAQQGYEVVREEETPPAKPRKKAAKKATKPEE